MTSKFQTYFPVIFIVILGVFIGLAGFTFIYAKGYSYFFDDPQACVNCHIMRENYNAWYSASHRDIKCNDCHTPHNPVAKYFVKAQNGFNHSWEFTFGPPDVIKIESGSANVVEANCIRCHKETLSAVFIQTHKNRQRCFDCHKGIGHSY